MKSFAFIDITSFSLSEIKEIAVSYSIYFLKFTEGYYTLFFFILLLSIVLLTIVQIIMKISHRE